MEHLEISIVKARLEDSKIDLFCTAISLIAIAYFIHLYAAIAYTYFIAKHLLEILELDAKLTTLIRINNKEKVAQRIRVAGFSSEEIAQMLLLFR